MNKDIQTIEKRKIPKKKKIMILLSIPIALYIILYAVVILLMAKSDPSSKDPLFSGPVIEDGYQKPLHNAFGHSTTAMEVTKGLDLKGKIIVMTGGHTGTGREAAKAFIDAGATVIALAPDLEWA